MRECFDVLADYWTTTNSFPTSQAHQALRKAREAGDLASETASSAAHKELDRHRSRMNEKRDPLKDKKILPGADATEALRLYFLLQQRDYVTAAKPWIDALDALKQKPGNGV
ncbi:MAG: hypothetical protein ACREC0_10575 [Methylocella sp.]